MKLNKIVSLCKREKRIVLFDEHNEEGEVSGQWIGDGTACYQVGGLPILEPSTVGTLFDVPAKDEDKWDIREEDLPPSVDFTDTPDGERMLEDYSVSLNYHGLTLKPLRAEGCDPVFVDVKYLAPFLDSLESVFLFRRETRGGMVYVAVKVGFVLKAIVPPCRVESEAFIESLSRLARDVRQAFFEEEDRDGDK